MKSNRTNNLLIVLGPRSASIGKAT